ncbi:TPA: hypothetical protein ACSP0P_001414 [Citrobacter freundii]|uniref:hypothetical protein n=1 Tax=Citrobacter freundii complex TaxID=1344959 RepID=UPI0008412C66|nr:MULTISPECIES: hypothetical protein [Citrobacter freundii complex]AOI31102.1 hypothetical protein BFQ28_15190 [Citrobacter freundii]MCE9762359.1 hypothetical protein [Citrobacter portucalensis]
MSSNNVDVTLYPVDAAYQVALELVKAGAFNNTSDRGAAFINTFDKLKERFEKVQEEASKK